MNLRNFYTPFILPLVGACTGIYIQETWPLPITILITGGLITLAVIMYCFTQKTHKYLIASCSCLLSFVAAGSLCLEKADHNLVMNLLNQKTVSLVGTIVDKDDWGDPKKSDVIRVSVKEIFIPQETMHHHIACDFLCYFKTRVPFHVGDIISINNVIIKPTPTSSATGNPSYADYMIKEHIIGSLFLINKKPITLINHPSWSIKRRLWQLRTATYRSLKHKLTSLTSTYFGLIFLGNKQQPAIDQLRLTFNYWGLAHYLARAGLHIVFFIFIWTFFLRFVPINISFKKIFLILICIAYDLLSWSSLPFVRAYYSFLLTRLGELWGFQTNFLHLLTLMCLIFLLFNPMQLFFLDFQLTFGLTFTLVFLSQLFMRQQKHEAALA
jgi:ComEC/Rec2-related protein